MADNDNNISGSELTIGNYSLLRKLDGQVFETLLPVTVYMSVLIVLGITGNSLVIFIWWQKMKPSSTNVCVLLLAFFDLLTCVLGMPLDIYDLSIQYTSDNPALCRLWRFLIDFSVYGSITVLVFIAILRFVKVCRPLTSFPVKSRGIIVISIGMGVGVSWPVLILHGLEIRPTRIPWVSGRGCGIDQHLRSSIYQNIYFSLLAFIFVAACVLLVVLYVCIAWHIFRRNQRRRAGTLGQSSKPDKKANGSETTNKKTESRPLSNTSMRLHSVSTNSLMFFAITLAFVLSFLPSMIMLSIKAQKPYIELTLNDWQYAAYIFCFRTYFINNCINPILYGFCNQRFREESVRLIKNCRSGFRKEKADNSVSANRSLEKPYPVGVEQAQNKTGNFRPPSSLDLSLDFSNPDKHDDCHIPADDSVHRVAKSKFYAQSPEPTAV